MNSDKAAPADGLDGEWTIAYEDLFTKMMNDEYPMYTNTLGLYMWWMWHGEVGHWVINDTPGEHGNDLVMSELDDFALPNEVTWKDSGDMVVSDEAPFVKPEFYGPETIYISENPGQSLDGEWTLYGSTYDGYPYYENADASMFMYWEWEAEGSNMGQWVIDGHLMKGWINLEVINITGYKRVIFR